MLLFVFKGIVFCLSAFTSHKRCRYCRKSKTCGGKLPSPSGQSNGKATGVRRKRKELGQSSNAPNPFGTYHWQKVPHKSTTRAKALSASGRPILLWMEKDAGTRRSIRTFLYISGTDKACSLSF